MATVARFIGIDRYADARIPDLSGATRDARALWALFTDSISDIDAVALVDEDANSSNIRAAIANSLDSAAETDTVVLMFAGHGTPDHRLVSHDTTLETVETTAYGMRELASQFRRSKARSIVCILDCCFSGDAPARVLGDLPRSRDIPFDSTTFSGEGRLLIAASALDEPAYEHPKERHGLLTHALMRTLSGEGSAVNVAAALAQTQELVRAEAAAMGRTQSPVVFGLVSRGLTMPALRRGATFLKWFPEKSTVVAKGSISELIPLGIPGPLVDAWSGRYPNGLNKLQLEAVNDFRILQGESILVVAPTSAGKTFIGELAAGRAIADGRKAVFLLPYRALVNEKYEQFLETYRDACNLRVIRCSGDYVDDTTAFVKGKYDVAVLTFEMFLALAVGNAGVLPRIGLVVVDEAQFITNPRRGIVVELILSYLRRARLMGIDPQLVALSATMGELNHFDEWLGLNTLISNARPVPLEFGVLDRTGVYQFLNTSGDQQENHFLSRHAVRQRGDKPSSRDVLIPLVEQLLSDKAVKEKILIFRNVRGATQGCANYLANALGLQPADAVLDILPTQDLSSTSQSLRRALKGGTAFHNTNLTREERVAVERAFRDPNSAVRILVATTTLAAGVNTPASTVIVVEHSFPWEDDGGLFSRADMKNMAGRAGRVGFRENGRAILLADSAIDRRRLFRRYVEEPPEAVRSSFDTADLGTWVLRLLSQVREIIETEVSGLLANTYGGYLQNSAHAGWQKSIDLAVSDLVGRMVSDGLLERESDKVHLTPLGHACGRASLSLESCLRLIELVRSQQSSTLTPTRLMVLIQALPEMDQQYTPMFKKGSKESQWTNSVSQRYGNEVAVALRRYATDPFTYWARLKRAAILADWVAGLPMNAIEERYTTNPFSGAVASGDVRSLADTTRFHLRSAADIASIAFPGEAPPLEVMDSLLRQLELGLPIDGLPLLEMPVRMERGEYLALLAAGIRHVEDYWAFTPDRLSSFLSQTRINQLEVFRPVASTVPVASP